MNEFSIWHQEVLANRAVTALQKNNFSAKYVKDKQAALAEILALIPPQDTIGIGGSSTIQELGLLNKLNSQGNTIYNHNIPGLSKEESLALRHKELASDTFITSSNAITLDGKLVNVDGSGNRVAAMIFGPKKVIVIVGVNKIVADVEAAERRIETQAAPPNCKRLNLPNPCVKTGVCMDCELPTRICNITTILRKKPPTIDMHVIIIGESLGF
jgi:hypothetical protein